MPINIKWFAKKACHQKKTNFMLCLTLELLCMLRKWLTPVSESELWDASQLLSNPHWLSVRKWVHFKVAILTYKVLSTQQPAYLYNLISYHQPSRLLRSSSQSLLHVPSIKTDFGRRAFSSAASEIWNYHIYLLLSESHHHLTPSNVSLKLTTLPRHNTHHLAIPLHPWFNFLNFGMLPNFLHYIASSSAMNVFSVIFISEKVLVCWNLFARSEVGTMFCLSWLITWYGHVLSEFRHIVRLYDFFMACHPLMPIYLAADVNINKYTFILYLSFGCLVLLLLSTNIFIFISPRGSNTNNKSQKTK